MSYWIVLDKLGLIDGSHTELTLDSADEWWALEECSSQLLQSLVQLLAVLDCVVESDNRHILFSCILLRLDQSSSTLDANNKAASDLFGGHLKSQEKAKDQDLGIKGSAMSSLLNTKNASDPGDNLVRGWVCGLVKVDDTAAHVV